MTAPQYRSWDGPPRWRPAGRALHLVDLENVVGWQATDSRYVSRVGSLLAEVSQVTDGDHVIVAANPGQLFCARDAFPGCRLLVGRGRDGADRALLGAVEHELVAERYDRLVIVSGDHLFTGLAVAARSAGCRVQVVSHPRSCARSLAAAADDLFVAPNLGMLRRRQPIAA